MAVYRKLKRFWNLASRSTVFAAIVIQEIKSIKSPGITRWNSEHDSMEEAYKKRDAVSLLF